jgi:hypothetical protein
MPGTIEPLLEHAAVPRTTVAAATAHTDLTLTRSTQTSKKGDRESPYQFEFKRRLPAVNP